MGMEFKNLTEEDLCDLMCGEPEEEPENESVWEKVNIRKILGDDIPIQTYNPEIVTLCADPFEYYDEKIDKIDEINKSYILSKKINKIKTKKRFYKMRKYL